METTGMIGLICYAVSIIACAVLAVYFLREYLDKRLRTLLWWATGFSLLACGVLAITVVVVYGLHRILVVLAFAFVAASVTFLYYAASLLLYGRRSFFRGKFAVILLVVSFVLFVLPLYLFPEERTASITESSAMILFAVAFLVIAVLFVVLFDQVAKVAVKLPKEYFCSRIGALQSLVLIVTVWSLYIALLWQSIIAVGLVLVLSLFGFVLLWYICKGGKNMIEEKEYKELNIQRIDGVEYKIKRKIDSIRVRLNDSMQKIGVALLYTMTAKDEKGLYLLYNRDEKAIHAFSELEKRNKMVTRASTIGMKEDELMVRVGELAENILGLARSAYENLDLSQSGEVDLHKTDGNGPPLEPQGNYFKPPLCACPAEMATDLEASPNATSREIERLATLAFFKSSTDRDMIETCCELVKVVCDLENNTVTKMEWENGTVTEMEWKTFPYKGFPRGMIGHTYNILHAYGKYAEDFKKRFQGEANELYSEAEELRKKSVDLMKRIQTTEEQPTSEQAEQATGYLNEAIALLQNASLLIKDASGFVGNRLNPPDP